MLSITTSVALRFWPSLSSYERMTRRPSTSVLLPFFVYEKRTGRAAPAYACFCSTMHWTSLDRTAARTSLDNLATDGALTPGPAEAAVGRHDMSRVSRQEHASLPHAFGYVGLGIPLHDAVDRHGNTIHAESRMNEFYAPGLGQTAGNVRLRIGRIAERVDRQES